MRDSLAHKYHKTTYTSGHTLHSLHIEAAKRRFEVEWEAPAKRVPLHDGYGLEYEATTRWAVVLAETKRGAIRIAKHHNLNGTGFRLRKEQK